MVKVIGTTGNDSFIAKARDSYDGLGGIDTIIYSAAPDGITGRLDLGTVVGAGYNNSLVSIENLVATAFDDVVYGSDGANVITLAGGSDTAYGGAGADRLDLGDGADVAYGGVGDDVILDGAGADIVYGGDGNDTLFDGADNDVVYGGAGDDVFIAGTGTNSFNGGDGYDLVDYSQLTTGVVVDLTQANTTGQGFVDRYLGIEAISGSRGDDMFTGDTGGSTLLGNQGDDEIRAGGGGDTLNGGEGNDLLNGGTGNDRISGGLGVDAMTGSRGADQFAFRAGDSGLVDGQRDRITDFKVGEDKIDLSGIANASVQIVQLSGNIDRVQIDTNRDGRTDMEIDVTVGTTATLSLLDFIF